MHPLSHLLAAALFLFTGAAEAAARGRRYDLPQERLGEAAIALARQAGISIGVPDPALAAARVRPVRGARSVGEALRKMLEGSGAGAVQLAPGTWLIVRSASHPKRPVRNPASQVRAPRPPTSPVRRSEAVEEVGEEIVVTGSKRRTRLAAYAGAATLIDGRELTLDGLRGTQAITDRVAAVTSTHLGPGRNKLFLRGIADSSFNGPTQATVGQYLGETRLNYNAPDPDLRLYDVARVEVLSGPQGTLYGAGSLGGIIRLIPNAPRLDAFEGAAALGASQTQHGAAGADGAGMLNVPLVPDRIGLRLVGYAESEGGYIDDLEREREDVNRTRIFGGRTSLRARTDSGWTVDAALTGQWIRGEDAQFADRDAPPLTRRSKVPQDFRSDYLLGDLVIAKSWDNLRLVTATGFVRQTLFERYDSTRSGGPPKSFEQANRITMFSADTRLSSDDADGSGWVIGTSFISNSSEQERALGDPAAPTPITGVRNSISEATLYGEGSFRLSDRWTLAAGGRFSHSRLSGAALDAPLIAIPLLRGISASRSETSFLPSLALTGNLHPGLLLYLRYQKGFRPGGLTVTGDLVERFRNDRVATVEGGLRVQRPRLEASASVSHTRWKDIQADLIDLSGMPTTQNIGDGRIVSLDLSLAWRPANGLKLSLAAVLNDSKVTNPAPTIIISPAAPLPNVARGNGRFAAEYATPIAEGIDLRLSASARYVGSSRLGIGPILGERQGDWLDTRFGARIETSRHAFSFNISNLLDQEGNRFALGSPFTLVERPQVTPLRPRTVRLGWEVRF